MATTIGEIQLIATIDTSKYSQGAAQMAATDKKMAASADASSKKASGGYVKMGATMGAVAGVVQSAFNKISSVISNSIGSAIKRVDTLNNFPKVMSNLNISAEDAAKASESLVKGLNGLPTSLDQGTLAVQRLTTTTKDVGKATDLFLAFNNAVIAGGAPMDLQATALEQFSQSFAKGKPDMMEWRSLMSAMPAQLDQLAKSMGKSNASKLGEDLRSGKVSMDDFAKAIVDLNQNGTGNFKSFEEQAKNATAGIGTGITNAQTAITRGVASIIQSIGASNISGAIASIGTALEKALKTVGTFIEFVARNGDVFGPIAVGIGTVVTAITLWAAVTKAMAIAQAALNIVLSANPIGVIIIAIAALVAGLVYFFTQTETGKAVLQGFFAVASTVFNAIKTAIGAVADFFAAAWDRIKSAVSSVLNWIRSNWPLILAVITGPIGIAIAFVVRNFDKIRAAALTVWNGIKAIFNGVVGYYRGIFTAAVNVITSVFGKLRGWFSSFWNGIKSLFSKVGTAVGNAIGGAFKGVINGIIRGAIGIINGFIRNINSVIGIVNKIPKVNVPTISELGVPALASGGIVSGATLAMIGEGNEPEAVIPLSKLDKMLNNSGSDTKESVITIYIDKIEKTADADEVIKILTRKQELEAKGITT